MMMRSSASGSAWPACQKNGKSGPPLLGAGGLDTICPAVFSAVTASPLVGCVVVCCLLLTAGCCSVVGGVIFVLSVMRVAGSVPL